MELHQIRYFLALCEERNFTRAARRCGVAQPSLTKAIKCLEAELGRALFNRSSSGTDLSPLGAGLVPHFRRVERALDDLQIAAFQPAKPATPRKDLDMARTFLKRIAMVIVVLGIGALVAAFILPHIHRADPIATATLNPDEIQRAVDVRTLPEQQVHEPY